MIHPLQALAHDHRELSGLLVAVHAAVSRVDRGQSRLDDEMHEIRDGIEAFREALLEHFAREQEGLLPFLLERLPRVHADVDGLIAEHDRIAEVLTRVVKGLDDVDSTSTLATWRAALARFEEVYSSHSKSEHTFLEEVASELAGDPAATEQLRTLLDET